MTVLITGAAGGVARLLVPLLRDTFPLRLTDRDFGDLTDPAFAREVTVGATSIVHLAGDPDPGHAWPLLRQPNADAVSNVLDAAVANGVERVILASSGHAMGGYADAGRGPIKAEWLPYPCCVYGAVKVFVEALGRTHSDQYDLRVICLRLGGVRAKPAGRSWLPGWLSPGDLDRLVTAALTAPVKFGVYHGVSANADTWWDISNDLGYEPLDDSARYADEVPDDTPQWTDPAARPRWGVLHRS